MIFTKRDTQMLAPQGSYQTHRRVRSGRGANKPAGRELSWLLETTLHPERRHDGRRDRRGKAQNQFLSVHFGRPSLAGAHTTAKCSASHAKRSIRAKPPPAPDANVFRVCSTCLRPPRMSLSFPDHTTANTLPGICAHVRDAFSREPRKNL